jgi:NADH:ubiquinone oxidoreductase subunit 3 (subunit A)
MILLIIGLSLFISIILLGMLSLTFTIKQNRKYAKNISEDNSPFNCGMVAKKSNLSKPLFLISLAKKIDINN